MRFKIGMEHKSHIDNLIKVTTEQLRTHLENSCQEHDAEELTPDIASRVTKALKDSLSLAGISGLKSYLESYDSLEESKKNSQRLIFKKKSDKEFLTIFGKMTVSRNLYQESRGGKSYVPLDEKWGVQNQYATVEVQEACLFTLAHIPPKESSEMFSKIAFFTPSPTAIDNIAKGFRDNCKKEKEELLEDLRTTERIGDGANALVCSMDGVNVLLNEGGKKRGRAAERPGKDKETEEKSSYKNAMVGSFTFYGTAVESKSGHIDIPRLDARYISRMPQDYAVDFKDEFEKEIAHFESALPSTVTKVLLMDGARGLWNYADNNDRFNDYEKLLDFYHASEHLSKAAEAIFGKKSLLGQEWYKKWKDKLKADTGAVKKLIRSLKYFRNSKGLKKNQKTDLNTEIRYFENNKCRMDYAGFIERGLPIGSGPVEAACKMLVKTRMCRSGMRWSRKGGQTILDLRTLVKSNRWPDFWKLYSDKCLKKTA